MVGNSLANNLLNGSIAEKVDILLMLQKFYEVQVNDVIQYIGCKPFIQILQLQG